MSLLQELHSRVHHVPRRPEVLTLRDDQAEQLAKELNDLRLYPTEPPRLTAYDIRTHGCHVFGIPIRIEA